MNKEGEKPQIQLTRQANGELKAKWRPSKGLWGKFTEKSDFRKVTVKEWWLFVGTKAHPGHSEEQSQIEIVSQNVYKATEWIIKKELLPKNKQVFAQVIGYFNSRNIAGEPIVEGIYSNVAHLRIK
jgi:hypothetical protein